MKRNIYLSLFPALSFAKTHSLGSASQWFILSLSSIALFIVGIAFIAGIGFGVATVFKFKQHKDNPQQHTIGNAIMMLMISISLVFFTGFYTPLGRTLFHRGYDLNMAAGGISGTGQIHFKHPDEDQIFF